jgi:hypothetical protein
MTAVGAIVKGLFAHLITSFALVFAMTLGHGLDTPYGVERTLVFAALLAAPFLLTDRKLSAPMTRTGDFRHGFLVIHHVLVAAPLVEIRGWARAALDAHHAHSLETSSRAISGWIGPVNVVGLLLPYVATARQYQVVIVNETSNGEGMTEITIAARPRRVWLLRPERMTSHCTRLVQDVEAQIGEQRLVLL